MAAEDEVRQASEQFYAALNRTLNGDPGPMEEIWSHGSDVSAMHPSGGRMVGWEEVRASWEQAQPLPRLHLTDAPERLLRLNGRPQEFPLSASVPRGLRFVVHRILTPLLSLRPAY